MIYDVKAGKTLPDTVAGVFGVKCFMSWRRLGELLVESGQIKPYEALTHIEIDGDGLLLVVETKPSVQKP